MKDDDDYVLVSKDEAYHIEETASLGLISDFIDSISDDLWPINKKIHDNPELGYMEKIAHATLTQFMQQQTGWEVTPSAYGIETAFIAVFDSGRQGPVVSFNAEMGLLAFRSRKIDDFAHSIADALPEIGHACGHNLIATASLAAALATAEMLRRRKLCGKVVLFGTPAEEGEQARL